MKPLIKPHNPNFSSGPCSKRPGWALDRLNLNTLGRSHRSALGKETLKAAIDKTRELLHIPETHRIGIVPASDTGAVELALWSLLGERPVDVAAWESFGAGWLKDIELELKLPDVTALTADYGKLPPLEETNPEHDIVFTWNGTTSGVRVPDADWISDQRAGLTICDATSAVFAVALPWDKLDVVTYSWQKVLGGEGAHGMLILGPRAVERLERWTPAWPMPKIFRLLKAGKLNESIFKGATINTPSMLCVADYLDALDWVASLGGLQESIARCDRNLSVLEGFVASHDWIRFLAHDPSIRSNTSVCLELDLEPEEVRKLTQLLAAEGVAYDIGAYRDAPSGLRIWCGTTVEKDDLEKLLPWLEWGYHQCKERAA
mgnify:CR=1 FL=1